MRFVPFLFAISALAGNYNISTVAGSDWVGENVPATSAILLQAEGIAADNSGNIYISDANNHRVRCLSPNGLIRTIAGNGTAGFAGDNGPASAAQLNSPYGLAFDFAGNLYIADLGNARIRRITPSGIISTVAGGGTLPAGGKNEGSMATLRWRSFAPRNIAVDGNGRPLHLRLRRPPRLSNEHSTGRSPRWPEQARLDIQGTASRRTSVKLPHRAGGRPSRRPLHRR